MTEADKAYRKACEAIERIIAELDDALNNEKEKDCGHNGQQP